MNIPPYIVTNYVPDDVVTEAVGLFLLDGTGDPADVIDPFWIREAHKYIGRYREVGYVMPNESRALWELALASVVDENGRFIQEEAE